MKTPEWTHTEGEVCGGGGGGGVAGGEEKGYFFYRWDRFLKNNTVKEEGNGSGIICSNRRKQIIPEE